MTYQQFEEIDGGRTKLEIDHIFKYFKPLLISTTSFDEGAKLKFYAGLARISLEKFEPNQHVFRHNEKGSNFFIILEGNAFIKLPILI